MGSNWHPEAFSVFGSSTLLQLQLKGQPGPSAWRSLGRLLAGSGLEMGVRGQPPLQLWLVACRLSR